ncbi:hypothetical protein BCE75_101238 [Isoptericola sp. CG 20/1183]|uniref:Uncharacterized protein n=1 Tax=Isoptericola halotolerans TaxID=300560 RepID=A0ABX5EJ51_9MICO|nr:MULTISPECIES: hypothetical protein [Isoptericola]MCK0118446.1 hypothetical protein [Isoptericola sp. S6320L]PRZ08642.1 hypothetical protein BCL65_102184 [Isoptericola halotolerans]PRZ10911.1 hypothetical protein BCE75_101238 [Isoptericola sp. CG 20/1183]
MSRCRTVHRRAGVLLGAAALVLGLALAPTSAPAAVAASENLPGVPEPGSPDHVWESWAAEERAQAEATDWDADAATRGCELQEVEISDEVDVDYNRAMGAPDDLATHRVDLVEDCSSPEAERLMGTAEDGAADAPAGDVRTLALSSGTSCSSTHGPGTACVYKSSGRIYASWKYRGSGSVSGFLRIYQISSSASGCYRGSTWLTGPSSTWSSGMTRSISKTKTTSTGYSGHIWKKVTFGHTDWGSACSRL